MRQLIVPIAALAIATLPSAAQETAPELEAPEAAEPAPAPAPEVGAQPEAEAPGSEAPEATAGMTLETIGTIVRRLDAEAQGTPDGRMLQFTIRETVLLFVSDPTHNRMRLMTPIRLAEGLTEEELIRMSQANFDSALDARYAIARGTLWSVFIHPLRELEERQFIAAIGQVVNAATSYGSSYSSGLLSFGGGDSNTLRQRELIDELLKQGQPI
ncbi:MAG: hypothetical protein AAFP17_03375 [Pseudomonadota bacterium]